MADKEGNFVLDTLNYWQGFVLAPSGADAKGIADAKHLKAYLMYMSWYRELLTSKSFSDTVEELTAEVKKADTLVFPLSRKPNIGDEVRKAASDINIEVFKAASWLRRFVQDRSNTQIWFDAEEQTFAKKIIEEISKKTKSLQDLLPADDAKVATQEKKTKKQISEEEEHRKDLLAYSLAAKIALKHKVELLRDSAAKLHYFIRELEDIQTTLKKAEEEADKISPASASKSPKSILKDMPRCSDSVTELLDQAKALTALGQVPFDENLRKSDTTQALLKEAALKYATPKWRKGDPQKSKGMLDLGPFGIQPIVQESSNAAWQFIRTTFHSKVVNAKELIEKKCNGRYFVQDETVAERYTEYKRQLEGEGNVIYGDTSPLSPVTIRMSDPTYDYIKIPPNAKYFVWAYPITVSEKKVHVRDEIIPHPGSHLNLNQMSSGDGQSFRNMEAKKIEKKYDGLKEIDLFLILGGFIYFDRNLKFLRANALLPVGSQLQFTSPFELTDGMFAELVRNKRFCPITLEFLRHNHGAEYFAWILPDEFTEKSKYGVNALPKKHAGGYAYCYESKDGMPHRTAYDNLFVLAAVES